jgi:methionyl-tRNA synthetase
MTQDRTYITTPIYYVNDRPHIGHCYTTTIADAAARLARLRFPGKVFFLTGTDEHAEKVVTTAAERGLTPIQWADRNAEQFRQAFAKLGVTNDDFIRTTQERHKTKVHGYIRRLMDSKDIYLGEYSGWYDVNQEEYLTETAAKDAGYVSPITGKPLVQRSEPNYFFDLPKYAEKLLAKISGDPMFVLPESRRNEVLGRLRDGLQPVPVSRPVTSDPATQFGIRMPGDESHRIYVWIDALFNYLSCVDTPERRDFWPPRVHLIGKEILWFHCVIWPALLMALGEELPRSIYAHSFWVRDGRKMSKSLGNFIDLELLAAYADRYSIDAIRWYLLTQGPLGATDADFSHGKFVEVYNADLANGLGNCASRVANMIGKYFGGEVPRGEVAAHAGYDFAALSAAALKELCEGSERFEYSEALRAGVRLVTSIDGYINVTQPFKLAKTIDPAKGDADPARIELGKILWNCAEALRVAVIVMSPAIPGKAAELLAAWGLPGLESGSGAVGQPLEELARFGGSHALKPGHRLIGADAKPVPLFARADPAEAAPVAAAQ